MAWTLNGTEIPTPNEYDEQFQFLGQTNTTLAGTRRRSVRGIKRDIQVQWKTLSNENYEILRQAFETQDPGSVLYTGDLPVLSVSDAELNISSMSCIMDMGTRKVIPGTDYLSNVTVTFYEV